MDKQNLSRRSFLASGAAAAALGGLALAGCSSTEAPASGASAASDAGAEGLPEKWDREVDVVVIGRGGILPAAFTVYERGLKNVLILEKSPTHFGGTTYFAGGGCSAPTTRSQWRRVSRRFPAIC